MTRPLILRIKRLDPGVILPIKAHADDAGFDVFAPHGVTVGGHGSQTVVPLGFSAELPPGYAALFVGKSSLAEQGLIVLGGLIDPGYRGQWKAVFTVTGRSVVNVAAGKKLCQFILLPVPRVEVVEVADLAGSARGAGGFGSTEK